MKHLINWGKKKKKSVEWRTNLALNYRGFNYVAEERLGFNESEVTCSKV